MFVAEAAHDKKRFHSAPFEIYFPVSVWYHIITEGRTTTKDIDKISHSGKEVLFMSMTVNTSSELGKAIDRGENRIIVKSSLGDAVLVIEAIGPVAWVIAAGAIAVAIAGVVTTVGTGGAGAPAGAALECIATPGLIATFGSVGTAATAIGIAVAGGGIGTLSTMRKYRAMRENGNVVLTRR